MSKYNPKYAKQYYKAWYLRNKDLVLNRTKKRDGLRREIINRAKTVPCVDCKKQYSPWVMQFDHTNPKDKTFAIGREGKNYSMDNLKQEIAKCEVVCANCHAERTHKQVIKHRSLRYVKENRI